MQIIFLWRLKDFVFDKEVLNEFKTRIPNAEYHIFENSGHYIFEEKPEETILLIEKFLNN